MNFNFGTPIAVKPVATVSAASADRCTINLDTGECTVTINDGVSGPVGTASYTFTLPGPTLVTVQNFLRNQLQAKLGVAVT